MNLKLSWHIDNANKNLAIGICDELPDTYSYFTVKKLSSDAYWVIPPTLVQESTANKLIFRDNEVARDFSNDFLNTNIKEILRHQIRSMKGSNAPTQQTVRYYEDFLQKVIDQLE